MRVSFDIPDDVLHRLLDSVPLPRMARISYAQPTPAELDDVAGTVQQGMRDAGSQTIFRPGQRIAIAVGSRGIARLPEIVAAVVREIRACGAEPFIVPSMGSHGGATASGQSQVLAHLGVTEESTGAPIESSMDTTVVGVIPDGTEVHLDRLAVASDGIVIVARIKPHTAFRGPYESGLAKMISIGLGKQVGAATTHARGFGEMAEMVPAMARVALQNAPIRMAVAALENAHDRPFKIVTVPADRIMDEEPALLDEARAAMPRIPFSELDVLVVDRIGKNISGDGADPNVTGRYPTAFATGGPKVNKQVVLDLHDATAGNATGIGTADFITVRAAQKMDLGATYPNLLTSTVAGPARIPMMMPTDELALRAAVLTCNAVNRPPRVVRIADTLHLQTMWISDELIGEAAQDPCITVTDPPAEIRFNEDGNLRDLV